MAKLSSSWFFCLVIVAVCDLMPTGDSHFDVDLIPLPVQYLKSNFALSDGI